MSAREYLETLEMVDGVSVPTDNERAKTLLPSSKSVDHQAQTKRAKDHPVDREGT